MLDWWKRLLGFEPGSEKPQVLLCNLWAKEANVLTVESPLCSCLDAQYVEEEAAADGREEFAPGREMDATEWTNIVTLPPTIAKLKSVKHLILYGSSLRDRDIVNCCGLKFSGGDLFLFDSVDEGGSLNDGDIVNCCG